MNGSRPLDHLTLVIDESVRLWTSNRCWAARRLLEEAATGSDSFVLAVSLSTMLLHAQGVSGPVSAAPANGTVRHDPAAELAAAVVAATGNGDDAGAVAVWRHEPASVQRRAVTTIFVTLMSSSPGERGA